MSTETALVKFEEGVSFLTPAEQQELAHYEAIIERGLSTFIETGNALVAVRDKRLYCAEYRTFEEYCQERWGLKRARAYQYIEGASVTENLSTMVDILSEDSKDNHFPLPINERQARPLTCLEPEQQVEAWQRAVETAPQGKITAAHVQAIVDEMFADETSAESSQPAWWQSSEEDDWWTPQWLFDLVDADIGFEIDVCASDANRKCAKYFTREQDGLAQEWIGKCWMNPPYGWNGGVSIYDWIEKAYLSAKQGATVACLIPARTDTLWWWDFCIHGEIRFLKGRLKFGNSDSNAPFPSAVVIFWPFVPVSKAKVIWWEEAG